MGLPYFIYYGPLPRVPSLPPSPSSGPVPPAAPVLGPRPSPSYRPLAPSLPPLPSSNRHRDGQQYRRRTPGSRVGSGWTAGVSFLGVATRRDQVHTTLGALKARGPSVHLPLGVFGSVTASTPSLSGHSYLLLKALKVGPYSVQNELKSRKITSSLKQKVGVRTTDLYIIITDVNLQSELKGQLTIGQRDPRVTTGRILFLVQSNDRPTGQETPFTLHPPPVDVVHMDVPLRGLVPRTPFSGGSL